MENKIYKLEQKLGYTFNNKDLIKVALTHSSKSNENKNLENNERLEFLGDAVLDLCVGAYLYNTLKKDKEGVLTKLRALIVCADSLYIASEKLDLGEFILLGKGEMISGGKYKKNIIADCFEAVLGAIYLDSDYETVSKIALNLLSDITKKAIEYELIKQDYATLSLEKCEIPENIDITLYIDDARQTIQSLEDNYYDAIFLDPFSQNMAPELFSTDFFKEFRRVIKNDGIVCTYTSSAPVRAAFIENNFHIGQGPIFGRKQGGTLASPNPLMLKKSLPKNDEIRIALSDVGIPFRDPGLNNSSEYILESRTEERHEARHNTKISSAVKTPIFLTQEMEDEKLKRRVERNLAKMNIPSTTSKEAFYILEPENNYLEAQEIDNNSRSRILQMIDNLKEVKENK